ncbi:hypothetical protein CONLIGDRAFT_629263 [Coniochaeta ligniaria NRRL 30616]|uniref:Uncharacterized protein n=1 Tax=Coniochaeta ligniaria NRRL 30616 TaxID=1408157 RepID=A0A1J7JV26_9PEZI|nr:hypothetical protein CONLIGDRAFT_629263 [Coniochaeta ligniaria NRRL 30616]
MEPGRAAGPGRGWRLEPVMSKCWLKRSAERGPDWVGTTVIGGWLVLSSDSKLQLVSMSHDFHQVAPWGSLGTLSRRYLCHVVKHRLVNVGSEILEPPATQDGVPDTSSGLVCCAPLASLLDMLEMSFSRRRRRRVPMPTMSIIESLSRPLWRYLHSYRDDGMGIFLF